MAAQVALLPPRLPAVRAVAACALVLGLLTAAYAAYCVHSPPCFIQCQCFADDWGAAALPRRLLWASVAQAAAAALSLLLPATGRARRALALLALVAGVASLAVLAMVLVVFTVYHLGAAGYGATLLRVALIGEGSGLGVVVATVVIGGFGAVLQGQE